MFSALPVFVDENANEVIFAVSTSMDALPTGSVEEIVTDTFRLSKTPMTVTKIGNKVEIVLE